MKLQSLTAGILAAAALASPSADAENKVAVHGSVQADILFPEDNAKIGTKYDSDSPILFNTWKPAVSPGTFCRDLPEGSSLCRP